MRSRWLLVLLAALPATARAQEPASVQEALLRAKPAVAMVVAEVGSEVTLNCGGREIRVTPAPFRETGTGWFVAPSGWMITNAHVVSPAYQPPRWVTEQQAQKAARQGCPQSAAQALATAKVKLEPSIYVILSNGVRLPATVAKYSPPVAGESMSGRDLALLRLEAADMPSLALSDSTALKIGDRLHILGFPGVVVSHELLNASAKVEASVTNGAVSGFKQDVTNQQVIQTDAPAAWGNSGGPAVDNRGDVVGVLTFVSLEPGAEGGIVQGFNFVIPAVAVQELLRGTQAPLGEASRFNAAWHAGLRDFFDGRYSRAEKSFTEANRLLPELPDVRRITGENLERIKNPPPRPFPWAMVTALVVLLSAGGYGAMWGARWKRNRFRIRPSEVAKLLEAPEPPVILDVRDTATYAKSPVQIPNARHMSPQDLETGAPDLRIDRARTVVAYCT